MAEHNILGKTGETLACEFLSTLNYAILETNWKYLKAEVDIIAREENFLVFVEVKTRTTGNFGLPYEFITPAKERKLAEAAEAYLEIKNLDYEIRFDVISIITGKSGQPVIEHISDAFRPTL